MIVLRSSFPEHALRAGDVATLVDFVDHPSSGPRGCVLELFNALGDSIGASVTVPEDAVEPLRADESPIGGFNGSRGVSFQR